MGHHTILGYWDGGDIRPEPYEKIIAAALQEVREPVYLIEQNGSIHIAHHGNVHLSPLERPETAQPLVAVVPPLTPESLGDPDLKAALGVRYAYVVGAMANAITSVDMVEAAGRAGAIGFFGAAGLDVTAIEQAAVELKRRGENMPYGFNLIHSPGDPELEFKTVELYLDHGIKLISASAYMDLTPPLVYYRLKGIHRDPSGTVVCPNRIVGKISREEVARRFFSPPPVKIVDRLVEQGLISRTEADLSPFVPMADIVTAEADSGGHTDNRPALTLLPTILALRNQMADKHGFTTPLHVGLGGGIATPSAAAAAFSMGAAYVLTGSINQACVEAGTSDTVRKMLAEAGQADVAMAPAADMFEMGVKVQVLKRGTMFPLKAAKLYDLYTRHPNYASIPEKERMALERDYFRCSFDEQWRRTRRFFETRDPSQIEKAAADPRHKMALVFRSYLGQSSNWANSGEPTRQMDYQVWCGPSIGAFNAWTKGTLLERTDNRHTAEVAMNLMLGAATLLRASQLTVQGVALPRHALDYPPKPLSEIRKLMGTT